MSTGSDDLGDSFPDWLRDKDAKRQAKKEKAAQGWKLRRSPLAKVSKKQKQRNKTYKEACIKHYSNESNRQCAICGKTENLSTHHSEKRGPKTADEETFITLCVIGTRFNELYPDLNHNEGLGCHQGVERNKTWARQHGYLS